MSDKEEETPVETGCCGGSGCCCSRSCSRTYKDGCLLSAQVLSIIAISVALILGIFISFWSFGYILNGIIGLAILLSVACLVLFMLTCCCRRPRRFIYATGVLAVVVSLCVAGLEVYLVREQAWNRNNNGWFVFDILLTWIIGLLSLLWLVAGILVLCFVASGRHANLENEFDKDVEEQDIEEQDIEAHAVEPHVIVEPNGTTPVKDA